MKIMKNILILVMLLSVAFSLSSAKDEQETIIEEKEKRTILLKEKEDTRSYWDKLSDKLKDDDDDDDDDDETYWDKFTDILPTDEIDEMLNDISDSIDIDEKEESMVESIEDTLPDMISKPASYAVKSASDMMRSALINDEEMDRLAEKDLKKMDNNQTIAKDIDRYYIDLQKIMKKIDIPKDLKLDVKVYMSPFLYIFTMPNGAIRVNSGIIEALDDNEVLFLMAHEIAHLKEKDHKASYRKAHAMFALENAINMSGEIVASASNGVLESVTSSMRKSQFQKDEEFAADEYAIDVLKKNGISKKAAVDALEYLQYMNAPLLKIHPTAHERIKNIKDNL